MSTKKFETEQEAINFAIGCISRTIEPEHIDDRLEEYMQKAGNAYDQEMRDYWKKQYDELYKWKESEDFKQGNYPEGINELMFQLFEIRSIIYAFLNCKTENDIFSKYNFFNLWLTGITYTIFAILGKLVSADKRDNSLSNLWQSVAPFIESTELSNAQEIEYLGMCLNRKKGYFTNEKSKALNYRNKNIAHNESKPRLKWPEIDKDIRILTRVWSLINMWCTIGIMNPFKESHVIFQGLESYYNANEIKSLIYKYDQSITEIIEWSRLCVIDDKRISNRTPFLRIEIGIK